MTSWLLTIAAIWLGTGLVVALGLGQYFKARRGENTPMCEEMGEDDGIETIGRKQKAG